ncbi:MAG: hypothetical protein PUP92_19950 [Rhizonema sp. PD38]|nr:hypothetical protein [Rhizonema sp. PD38]
MISPKQKKSNIPNNSPANPRHPIHNSKFIDEKLSFLVEQIEKQSPGLVVLAARQFRYNIQQIPVEVTVSEPRKFNVLEEFILRASIEFVPSPTVKELAEVLGLDIVFVQSTTVNLKGLQSLEVSETGALVITPQGREFYKQGTVSLPPQMKQIYAIADPFQQNIKFQFESLSEKAVDLPDLSEVVSIENLISNINSLTITEAQSLIQASGLGIHVPEQGKIVSNLYISHECQAYWEAISIFILFDVIENRYIIQVRQGKQILEKASNWLADLEAQQQVSLNELCQLTADAFLCWDVLEMEDYGLKQLHKNNWQEYPLWLKVVSQGLKLNKIPVYSKILGIAISLLGEISVEDSNIEFLRSGWQSLMEIIASVDSNAAISLLNDEAWANFTRLGITQLPLDSPEKFVSQFQPISPKKSTNPKSKRSNKSIRDNLK